MKVIGVFVGNEFDGVKRHEESNERVKGIEDEARGKEKENEKEKE